MSDDNACNAGSLPGQRHHRPHLTVAGRVPAALVDEPTGVRPPRVRRRSIGCIARLARRVLGALRRRVGH